MSSILAFLGSIPTILEFVKQVVAFLKAELGLDWKGYLKASTEAFRKLNEAKTQEEKYVAAQELQKLLGKLG